MTDTMLGLYILLQLDQIKSYITGLTFFISIGVGLAAIMFFAHAIGHETTEIIKRYRNWFIYPTIATMLLGLLNTLIPSTERAAVMIVGAKVIDSNTTSILTNIPEKYAKILEAKAQKYMDEQLKETE